MISSFKGFLAEESKTAYFTYARMNPPTIGHEKVLNQLGELAEGNQYKIFLSQSHDDSKNPLMYESKVKFARKMFPRHARQIPNDTSVKNVFEAVTKLYNEGHKRLVMVVGSDRVNEFDTLLRKYNGVEARHGLYEFTSIKVVSAGMRDPDAEGVEGMSASKMRSLAESSDFTTFSQGVPTKFSNPDTRSLYNAVRKGMGLNEQVAFKNHVQLEKVSTTREAFVEGKFQPGDMVIIKESDEVATVTQRGANYLIVEMDGKQHRKWLDAVELVEEVSRTQINNLEKFADNLLRKFNIDIEFTRHFVDRVNDSRNNPEITIAELQRFFKKVQKSKGTNIKSVDDLQVVLKDVSRFLNMPVVIKRKGNEFEVVMKTIMRKKNFMTPNKVIAYEETEVAQDPDVEDKPGTQPKKYYKGLSKATKIARDRHFRRNADSESNEPAPGDADAETKPAAAGEFVRKLVARHEAKKGKKK